MDCGWWNETMTKDQPGAGGAFGWFPERETQGAVEIDTRDLRRAVAYQADGHHRNRWRAGHTEADLDIEARNRRGYGAGSKRCWTRLRQRASGRARTPPAGAAILITCCRGRRKLARGHHAAMPYEEVVAFVAELRNRDATAAQAQPHLEKPQNYWGSNGRSSRAQGNGPTQGSAAGGGTQVTTGAGDGRADHCDPAGSRTNWASCVLIARMLPASRSPAASIASWRLGGRFWSYQSLMLKPL